jgi:hypothetical protein
MAAHAIAERDLGIIFRRLKVLLKKYEPPLVSKIDMDSRYDLWSVKNIVVEGRPRKGGSGGIYHGRRENEGKEILSGG